jgi:hypothetical protein
MNEIKRLVIGNTTEMVIKAIFDNRIAQESTNESLNTTSRALKIRDLKAQVMGFIKRNPNSLFELVTPEYSNDKQLKVVFSNFPSFEPEEEEDISSYKIIVEDNFVGAEIVQRVKVGKDITLRIKAE